MAYRWKFKPGVAGAPYRTPAQREADRRAFLFMVKVCADQRENERNNQSTAPQT